MGDESRKLRGRELTSLSSFYFFTEKLSDGSRLAFFMEIGARLNIHWRFMPLSFMILELPTGA